MRGRTAVEFWSETLRALKLATSVVAVTVGAFIPYYWLQLLERCAAMASKAMAHLDMALCMRPPDPQNVRIYMALAAAHYAAGRPPGGAAASGFFRRSPNLRGQPSARWTDGSATLGARPAQGTTAGEFGCLD